MSLSMNQHDNYMNPDILNPSNPPPLPINHSPYYPVSNAAYTGSTPNYKQPETHGSQKFPNKTGREGSEQTQNLGSFPNMWRPETPIDQYRNTCNRDRVIPEVSTMDTVNDDDEYINVVDVDYNDEPLIPTSSTSSLFRETDSYSQRKEPSISTSSTSSTSSLFRKTDFCKDPKVNPSPASIVPRDFISSLTPPHSESEAEEINHTRKKSTSGRMRKKPHIISQIIIKSADNTVKNSEQESSGMREAISATSTTSFQLANPNLAPAPPSKPHQVVRPLPIYPISLRPQPLQQHEQVSVYQQTAKQTNFENPYSPEAFAAYGARTALEKLQAAVKQYKIRHPESVSTILPTQSQLQSQVSAEATTFTHEGPQLNPGVRAIAPSTSELLQPGHHSHTTSAFQKSKTNNSYAKGTTSSPIEATTSGNYSVPTQIPFMTHMSYPQYANGPLQYGAPYEPLQHTSARNTTYGASYVAPQHTAASNTTYGAAYEALQHAAARNTTYGAAYEALQHAAARNTTYGAAYEALQHTAARNTANGVPYEATDPQYAAAYTSPRLLGGHPLIPPYPAPLYGAYESTALGSSAWGWPGLPFVPPYDPSRALGGPFASTGIGTGTENLVTTTTSTNAQLHHPTSPKSTAESVKHNPAPEPPNLLHSHQSSNGPSEVHPARELLQEKKSFKRKRKDPKCESVAKHQTDLKLDSSKPPKQQKTEEYIANKLPMPKGPPYTYMALGERGTQIQKNLYDRITWNDPLYCTRLLMRHLFDFNTLATLPLGKMNPDIVHDISTHVALKCDIPVMQALGIMRNICTLAKKALKAPMCNTS